MKIIFRKLLIGWIVISAFLAIVSFLNVRNSGEEVRFILWASGIGAFVWEDMLIFALYNIMASSIILWIHDFRCALLFADVFWIVRSVGETFYWFLQQFNQPTEYPHNYYAWNCNGWVKFLLGNISNQKFFILFQIFWQVATVLAIVGLIWILKNWQKLGKKLNE